MIHFVSASKILMKIKKSWKKLIKKYKMKENSQESSATKNKTVKEDSPGKIQTREISKRKKQAEVKMNQIETLK